MNTRLEILSILLIIAAAQGYLLMVLLMRKRKKRSSNFWIALLVGLIASAILSQAFEIKGLLSQFLLQNPLLYVILEPVIWLFGPFYFFYIHRLLKSRKLKFWEYLIHFFPAGVKALSFISLLILSDTSRFKFIQESKDSTLGGYSEQNLFMFAILLYLIWGSWEIFRFKWKADHKSSLNWIWYPTLFMVVVWCFHMMVLALPQMQFSTIPQNTFLVVLGWASGIYAMGYAQWKFYPSPDTPTHTGT